MTAKDRDDRHAHPGELLADLELVIDGKPPKSAELAPGRSSIGGRGVSDLKRVLKEKRRRRYGEERGTAGTAGDLLEPVGPRGMSLGVKIAIGAVAALLLAGTLAWVLGRGGDEDLEVAARVGWQTEIVPLERVSSREEAVKLLAALGAFEGGHGRTEFARARGGKIARLKAAAEKLLAAGSEKPPSPDEDRKTREMYELAESLWKKNPGDFAGALERFEKVRRAGKGTKWELVADDAIAGVKGARRKAADAAFAELEKKAKELAAAGDYDGALAAYGGPPKEFAGVLRARCESARKELRRAAEAKFGAAMAAAEQHSKGGRPEAGLAELAKVEAVRYAAVAGKLSALRARLEKEKLDVVELAEKRRAGGARKAFAAILGQFDKLMLAGKWRAAGELLDREQKKLDAGTLELMPPGLDSAATISAQLERWEKGCKTALKKLVGRKVSLKTRAGGTSSGTVTEVTADAFKLKRRFKIGRNWGETVRSVKFADLAPGELERLLRAFEPQEADGRVALGLLLARSGKLSGALQSVRAARSHPLCAHYERKFREMQVGAAEVAAEDAWKAEVLALNAASLDVRGARRLLAGIDGYMKHHGKTRYAAGRAKQADELRKRAEAVIEASPEGMTARVKKLFRGKIVKFDPRTLAIELLYDFEDPKQLEDFELMAGDWRVEDGKLFGSTHLALWTSAARPHAHFAPKMRVAVKAGVRQGYASSLRIGAPSDWASVVLTFKAYKGVSDKALRIFRSGRRRALGTLKKADMEYGTVYPFEAELANYESRFKCGSQKVGVARGMPHKYARVALAVSHMFVKGPTVGVFDDLRIAGTLHRQWLEKATQEARVAPALGAGFRASWNREKTVGASPSRRSTGHSAMAYDSKRKVCVLFGGYRNGHLNDLWALNLGSKRWTCLQKSDLKGPGVGKSRPRPCNSGDRGYIEYDSRNDLYWLQYRWAFDPKTRAWRTPAPKTVGWKPPYMWDLRPGWTYDPDGKRMLWHKGGMGAFIYPNTERAETVPGGPPSRSYVDGGLAYDRREKLFVLFGGYYSDGKKSYNDTWTYNPRTKEWRMMRPKVMPAPRTHHNLVWHEKLGALVMALGGGKQDLWVYETGPDRWTEVPTPTMPPSRGATAYDGARELLVLFSEGQTWTLKIERVKQ